MEIEEEKKESEIFKQGCAYSNIKSLNFTKTDGILLKMFYDKPPTGFFETLLATC